MVSSPSREIAPIYQNAIAQTASHYKVMVAFVKAQMQKDIDYGVIPGTSKPTLLKPGAEKLCRLFNLRPSYERVQSVADFDKPLFHYHYRCVLYRSGEMVGQGDGCCNSMEVKYQKQKHRVFDLTNTVCLHGSETGFGGCCPQQLWSKRILYPGFRRYLKIAIALSKTPTANHKENKSC